MKGKKRLLALLLVNLCPAILGLLCFREGYISDMLVIHLTPISLWLNARLTTGIKKLIMWNGLFMLVSGAELILSSYLYQWKVAADVEGVMVANLFFTIWLCVSTVFALGVLGCAFWMQRRKKETVAVFAILFICMAAMAGFYYLAFVPAMYEESYVVIYNYGEIDYNEKYEGQIGYDSVIIRDREDGTKRKFSEEKLGIHVREIALGENYFYVLGSEKIAKVDYEGNVVAKQKVGFISLMTCRDGTLFLWEGDYDDDDEDEDYDDDDNDEAPDIPNHFYADKYIKEEDFEQGHFTDCVADEQGICQVGNVRLYSHGKYFSSNPPITSYKGENGYHVDAGAELEKKKKTQWTELVEKMLDEKGLAEYSHTVSEYQDGNCLYGVVEVRDSFLGFEDKKLKECLAYKISVETGQISVLAEKENVFMIIASDDCVVYQDHNKIVREEFSTGKSEQLITIYNARHCDVGITGAYLQVENEENKQQWVRWSM